METIRCAVKDSDMEVDATRALGELSEEGADAARMARCIAGPPSRTLLAGRRRD